MGYFEITQNQIQLMHYVYIIHHGLVKFPLYQYGFSSMITHARKSHQYNKNSFYHSFLPQTIPLWNNLPPHPINQSSPNHFQTLLDNIDFTYIIIVSLFSSPMHIAIPLDVRTVMVNN